MSDNKNKPKPIDATLKEELREEILQEIKDEQEERK